jgi:hypothetical protein
VTWAAYGPQNPSDDGIRRRDASEAVNRAVGKPQVNPRLALIAMGAPSRIRTCAHGSGGRFDLSL